MARVQPISFAAKDDELYEWMMAQERGPSATVKMALRKMRDNDYDQRTQQALALLGSIIETQKAMKETLEELKKRGVAVPSDLMTRVGEDEEAAALLLERYD